MIRPDDAVLVRAGYVTMLFLLWVKPTDHTCVNAALLCLIIVTVEYLLWRGRIVCAHAAWTDQAGTKDAITWAYIQEPGNATHKRPKAPTHDEANTAIRKALADEQRPDSKDWLGRRKALVKTPRFYFYESTKHSQYELYPTGNGLFSACHNAWAHHGTLLLSPDDIWIAIQAIFAKYMNANAEALRSVFASHAGKKELRIAMDDAPEDWPLFMKRVVTQVTQNSKMDMDATFVPPFSSSTALDATMKHLAVMDHMQQYFAYTFSLQCGVRRVGLRGSLEDWRMLRAYIQGLGAFALQPKEDAYFTDDTRTFASWLRDLTDIADKLIQTHQGYPDVNWWNRMITERTEHGSKTSTYLKGWITALVSNRAIDQEMSVDSVPTLRFSVPVKHDNNGVITNMRILGGLTGCTYCADLDVWSPQRSFAVMDDVSTSAQTAADQ
jgi:hypothetical protein